MKISDPVSRKKRSLKLPASAVLTLKSPLRSEAVDSLIRDFVVAPPLERIESNESIAGAPGQAALGMVRLLGVANAIVAHSTAEEAKGFDTTEWLGRWIEVMTVADLARHLGRNYKNVHTDVQLLTEWLAVERGDDGRVSVPWSEIVVDMKLPQPVAA